MLFYLKNRRDGAQLTELEWHFIRSAISITETAVNVKPDYEQTTTSGFKHLVLSLEGTDLPTSLKRLLNVVYVL